MAKKVVANGDDTPFLFSPETFARHEEAVRRVEGTLRTGAPRGNRSRFPGLSYGVWGLLASGDTITARSGITLGSGSVKLCDAAGTVYPEDETVDVANAGGAITASGDTIVALRWIEGEWVACECGGVGPPGSCADCFPPYVDLTVSDSNATFTMVADLFHFPIQWHGGYNVTVSGVSSAGPSTFGQFPYTLGDASVHVGYTIECRDGGTDGVGFFVFVAWHAIFITPTLIDGFAGCGITGDSTYHFADDSISLGLCSPPSDTNPSLSGKSTPPGSYFPITSCNPVAATGTIDGTGILEGDIAPGSITVTSTPREQMERWLSDPDPQRRRHAAYKLHLLDHPNEPPGVLMADGRYVPGDVSRRKPPSPEDLALREYLQRHGCGGCGG